MASFRPIWVDRGTQNDPFSSVLAVRRPSGRETLDVHGTPLPVLYAHIGAAAQQTEIVANRSAAASRGVRQRKRSPRASRELSRSVPEHSGNAPGPPKRGLSVGRSVGYIQFYGRTEFIIGVSKAKKRKPPHDDVHFNSTPPNLTKNSKKLLFKSTKHRNFKSTKIDFFKHLKL